jgi:SynChlorMet cassette radical SAM/SPASM protein ScmF
MTETRVPRLEQLYFYLTEGCNLACRHCWLAPKYDPDGSRCATLPVHAFETAIHAAKPLGLIGIKLTGGEPLLHPEFVRLLEIAQREDLQLTIETNGLRCTPEIAAKIAQSVRPFVSVSMDGANATTHDRLRGVSGSFEKAQQAVRNLIKVGVRPQVIFSIMRSNADQVEAVIQMAENLGAASVKLNIVQPTGRGELLHDGIDGLPIADLVALGQRVERELAPSTTLRLTFDHPLAFQRLGRLAGPDGCSVCGISGILGVLPSGHYALCGIGEHVPKLVFGAVGTDCLAAIWQENQTLRALREGLPHRLEGVCARCLMRYRCLAACIAQNHYRTGSLWSSFWFCEQAEEAGLFPASRLEPV